MPGLIVPEDTETQKFATGAFGELMVEQSHPVMQFKFTYWIPERTFEFTTDSAAISRNSQAELKVTSGTTAGAKAIFRSKRSIVYRPGQGNMARFTARFETGGVANSKQFAGVASATDGLVFGYNGTTFGILHRHHGLREIQSLQITTQSSGSENATVNVNGTAYTVPLTSGTVQANATEIFDYMAANDPLGQYEQIDDTVFYLARLSDVQGGTFSFSSATAAGTWTSVATGVVPTEDWIAQADWNENAFASLDPAKGNVYQVQYQYLGYGELDFFVEDPETGKLIHVHHVKYSNANIKPSFTDPSMYICTAVISDTSTTDISVYSASMAAFRQGVLGVANYGRSKDNLKNISTTETCLLTIKSRIALDGLANHGEIIPKNISLSTESGKTTTFRVYIGATLGGSPNFQYIDSGASMALYDTAATTISGGTLVASKIISGVGSDEIHIDDIVDSLVDGEQLTITAVFSGTPAEDASAAISWSENT